MSDRVPYLFDQITGFLGRIPTGQRPEQPQGEPPIPPVQFAMGEIEIGLVEGLQEKSGGGQGQKESLEDWPVVSGRRCQVLPGQICMSHGGIGQPMHDIPDRLGSPSLDAPLQEALLGDPPRR